VWATGVLLYALLCGHFPFKGASDKELYKKISKGLFTPPDHMSREARHFLQKMLIVEPERRYTAQQLLEDPWIKSKTQAAAAKDHTSATQNQSQISGKAGENRMSSVTTAATIVEGPGGGILGGFLSTNESSGGGQAEAWKMYEQRLIERRQHDTI
jgi:serine/threonine protein kinase